MEITGLMIGDWLLDSHVYAQVTSITCDGIIETTHNALSDIELVEPIPITPEILEKNGFIKDNNNMYYWNWGIIDDCVSYDKETNIFRIFHTLGHLVFVHSLSYVHQLQHALRLCGIEKDIEL